MAEHAAQYGVVIKI